MTTVSVSFILTRLKLKTIFVNAIDGTLVVTAPLFFSSTGMQIATPEYVVTQQKCYGFGAGHSSVGKSVLRPRISWNYSRQAPGSGVITVVQGLPIKLA